MDQNVGIVYKNVVIAYDLGAKLDLKRVCLHANRIIMHKQMPCLIWRHKSISATALIFSSGYMSVHGSNTLVLARKAGRQYARLLQRQGYNIVLSSCKILTITGVISLPNRLCMSKVTCSISCMYEPEIFPAAIFTLDRLKMLVYSSGKIVITGLRKCYLPMKIVSIIRMLLKC